METENMLTVEDVATRLQVSEETVRRWLRAGKLEGVALGRKAGWRIYPHSLEQLLGRTQRQSQTVTAYKVTAYELNLEMEVWESEVIYDEQKAHGYAEGVAERWFGDDENTWWETQAGNTIIVGGIDVESGERYPASIELEVEDVEIPREK